MSEEVWNLGRESDFIRRVPIEYHGERYVLKSADAEAAVAYENAQLRGTQRDPETGKVVGQVGLADTEPLLVHLCLWNEEETQRIPERKIRSWPAFLVKRLFDKAKEISNLGLYSDLSSMKEYCAKLQEAINRAETEEERIKNSSSGIPGG